MLNDLVRSYMSGNVSVVPQFLQASFDMLRDGQAKMMENMSTINPIATMPGMEAVKAQQEAFMKAMTGGWGGKKGAMGTTMPTMSEEDEPEPEKSEDLDAIKKQLAELQDKLSKMK